MKNTIDKLNKLCSKLEHDSEPFSQALCTVISQMCAAGNSEFDYQLDDNTLVVIQYNKIIVCEINNETGFFEETLLIEVK